MAKFKAVFFCLNSKYIHSSLAPWCLFSSCKNAFEEKIDLRVVEGTINEKSENVSERVILEKPDAVLMSCYIWNITKTLETAKEIKSVLPETKIILGGPEVSFNSERILKENSFVDYVLCGEGEESSAFLLEALSQRVNPEREIATMRTEEGIVCGKYHIAEKTVSPYTQEYLECLKNRIAYIESSRGCPYNCAFCLSGDDRSVRFFDLERIKKEILLLSQSGTKTVKFVDRTFNCNKKRANEILLFIKEAVEEGKIKDVCFHFEIAADILADDTLEIISQMPKGAVQFEAGIQSFNPLTLEKIHRKTNLEKLCRNIERLISFKNCHIHIDLIAGLPFEDLTSLKESFNKAFSLRANMLQLGFLKILYGSCMKNNREEFPCLYKKEPPYEVIETMWLSSEELSFLHEFEDAFERLYNSGRFRRTLEYVLEVSKLSPFEVFAFFADFIKKRKKQNFTLDEYTALVFEYFSSQPKINPSVLRDKMITDRIATNSSGIIPKCLQIEDGNLRKVKHEVALSYPKKKNIMRSVAILYSENAVLLCDYTEKDVLSGEYPLKYLRVDI